VRFQSAAIPRRDFGVLETCLTKPVLQNSIKLRVRREYCQPSEITGFQPDFNSTGSLCRDRVSPSPRSPTNSLQRVRKRSSTGSPQNPAQAEAEDSSKIKDRLEALLFAETLQGTLSPNANPGRGSVGGLLNLMPKATARIQRAAQTLVHLSSVDFLYQSEWDCARGE
jgi:hypothetical protein